MMKLSWTLLAAVAAFVLFAAPGPVEPSCNPTVLFSGANANAIQLGGVNSKREVAWFVASGTANNTGFYVKFFDGNTAPTVGTTAPAAVFPVAQATTAPGPVTSAPGSFFPMQFVTGLWATFTTGAINSDNNTVGNNNAMMTVCWM